MEITTRQTLELFVEKADLLKGERFAESILESDLFLRIKFNLPGEVEHTIPESEFIGSCILTLRMFFQNNDCISIWRIAELLDDPGLSREWKDFFSEKRDQLNSYLDHPGGIGIACGEKLFTNREIFKVFVYGDIAHTNKEKRAIYQEWKNFGVIFSIIKYAFATILTDILILIWEISDATKQELDGQPIIVEK